MLTLVWANIFPILASFLIGIAIARWTFPRPPAADPSPGPESS